VARLLLQKSALLAEHRNDIRELPRNTCNFYLTPRETTMGRGILLWLLGVPIPIIILLALFWH
jgi:hypothetical protein